MLQRCVLFGPLSEVRPWPPGHYEHQVHLLKGVSVEENKMHTTLACYVVYNIWNVTILVFYDIIILITHSAWKTFTFMIDIIHLYWSPIPPTWFIKENHWLGWNNLNTIKAKATEYCSRCNEKSCVSLYCPNYIHTGLKPPPPPTHTFKKCTPFQLVPPTLQLILLHTI